ncbi:Peptidase S46, partial [human gut metagenome]
QASEKVRLQYANKYAGSSNYWKNSIGESRGLRKLNVKGQKEALEAQFQAWAAADPARQAKYGDALKLIKESVAERIPYENYRQYISEALLRGTEIIAMAGVGNRLLEKGSTRLDTVVLAARG